MSCLEEFLEKPVVMQLRRPIAAVYAEEYDEDHECGVTIPVQQRVPRKDAQGRSVVDANGGPVYDTAPVTAQVLIGSVEKVSADGIIFETKSLVHQTVNILVFVPLDCIESVSLSDSAIPKAEETASTPKIVTP